MSWIPRLHGLLVSLEQLHLAGVEVRAVGGPDPQFRDTDTLGAGLVGLARSRAGWWLRVWHGPFLRVAPAVVGGIAMGTPLWLAPSIWLGAGAEQGNPKKLSVPEAPGGCRCLPCAPGFLPQSVTVPVSPWEHSPVCDNPGKASQWAVPVATAGLQHISCRFLGNTGEWCKGLAEGWGQADTSPGWWKPQPTSRMGHPHFHWATCSTTADWGQLPQPAPVCHEPQLLTISKAWAGPISHTSVALQGCRDQEGTEESIDSHQIPKKRGRKIFCGFFFFWFIGLVFLKFIPQHWKLPVKGPPCVGQQFFLAKLPSTASPRKQLSTFLAWSANTLYARLTSLIHQGLLLSSDWSNPTSRAQEPQWPSWG